MSSINYGAPVWSTNASTTSFHKLQIAQNEVLRISTGSHLISSVDHLHAEAEMLPVDDHSELLSAQYLAKCLQPTNVCHNITIRGPPPRRMKNTLYTRHRATVKPLMTDGNLKDTLNSIHTTVVIKANVGQKKNRVLDDLSPANKQQRSQPPKKTSYDPLPAKIRTLQLLGQYKKRIAKDDTDSCADCRPSPQDVLHFSTAHPIRQD